MEIGLHHLNQELRARARTDQGRKGTKALAGLGFWERLRKATWTSLLEIDWIRTKHERRRDGKRSGSLQGRGLFENWREMLYCHKNP